MEIIRVLILTLLLGSSIIITMLIKGRQNRKKNIHRQSDTHHILKHFFSRASVQNNSAFSQSKKLSDKNSIKVIFVEDKAYWVDQNVFYVSGIINGKPDINNAHPIDTNSLSKKDLDKMLFILDNLNGGSNDSSSTGN